MREKKWYTNTDDIKELFHWEYADGCIATDRILVDGCKVGYMYREEPDNVYDSGWRFQAGDESDEYMQEAANHGAYKLNTIANCDPGIIPFLYSGYGSAFYRDDDGDFQKDPNAPSQTNKTKMPKLYAVIFKFIAGSKIDHGGIRVFCHGIMIYTILLALFHLVNLILLLLGVLLDINLFPTYTLRSLMWGLLNITLTPIAAKWIMIWYIP